MIDQRFPYRYIFFFVCIAVPLETFLSCGNFLRSANDPNLTVSCLKKNSHCVLSRLLVVYKNTVTGKLPDPAVNEYNGLSGFLKFFQMIAFRIYRHADDPVHTLPA